MMTRNQRKLATQEERRGRLSELEEQHAAFRQHQRKRRSEHSLSLMTQERFSKRQVGTAVNVLQVGWSFFRWALAGPRRGQAERKVGSMGKSSSTGAQRLCRGRAAGCSARRGEGANP